MIEFILASYLFFSQVLQQGIMSLSGQTSVLGTTTASTSALLHQEASNSAILRDSARYASEVAKLRAQIALHATPTPRQKSLALRQRFDRYEKFATIAATRRTEEERRLSVSLKLIKTASKSAEIGNIQKRLYAIQDQRLKEYSTSLQKLSDVLDLAEIHGTTISATNRIKAEGYIQTAIDTINTVSEHNYTLTITGSESKLKKEIIPVITQLKKDLLTVQQQYRVAGEFIRRLLIEKGK